MTTIELLRQRAVELAGRLDMTDEAQLRRIAVAVAEVAVERAGVSHPAISEAVAHLKAGGSPDPKLRARVGEIAEQLDAEYLDLSARYEERDDCGKTAPEVVVAFSKARAASAVMAALGSDARTAAAEAAYEAVAASDDSQYLTEVVERVLKA